MSLQKIREAVQAAEGNARQTANNAMMKLTRWAKLY